MTNDVIILDMDESRELKWTFGAIKTFEKRSREILKRMDIKDERGRSIASMPTHAGFLLANYLRLSDILEAAVGAACDISALDGKDKPSEATIAIDGYLGRGGSLEALQQAIYRAYLVANDPSSLSEWEGNIQREQEVKRINREKQEAKVELARMELADDQKKILRLKMERATPAEAFEMGRDLMTSMKKEAISGAAPTSSPTSS